jgi:hypothetical protein
MVGAVNPRHLVCLACSAHAECPPGKLTGSPAAASLLLEMVDAMGYKNSAGGPSFDRHMCRIHSGLDNWTVNRHFSCLQIFNFSIRTSAAL